MVERELENIIKGTVLELIGETPIVKINRLNRYEGVEIYTKLERFNPGGSVKDRAALFLISDALRRGVLNEDKVVVEASSGNMAISLALICSVLKLKVLLIVPRSISKEMDTLVKLLGAEVRYTPAEDGTDGAIRVARKLSESKGYHWLAQHFNEVNIKAHYETTGKEIAEYFKGLGKRVDFFVATTGTTGTIVGAGRRLKEEFRGLKVVAVYPSNNIRGVRRPVGDKKPGIYDESVVDRIIEVKNEEALRMVKLLAREEGLLVGPSSGAAICASLKIAREISESNGKGVIVTIFPDGIERYLSTEVSEALK